MTISGVRIAGGLVKQGRCLAWLAAAYLAARAAIYLYGWVSPYGAVAVFCRGESFQKPRWVACMRYLDFIDDRRPAPFVSKDHYSVRIKSRLRVPKAGDYEFATLSDDGIRLNLDGHRLIDNWKTQNFYRSGQGTNMYLDAGFHQLEVEFFNACDLARFRIEWCGGPIPPRTILGPPFLYKPAWGEWL